MMSYNNVLYCVVVFILLFNSCSNLKQDRIVDLLGKWEQREILFPENAVFTIQGRDTVDFPIKKELKIISYIDSMGCTSCKMKLREWNEFRTYLDSCSLSHILIYFYVHPRSLKEIKYLLRRDNLKFPICLDINDSLNILNKFPSEMAFQTFLLDKDNKVLAIGNPIHNPKVKELYLKIIRGEKVGGENKTKVIRTKVDVDHTSVSLGSFDWKEEQKTAFVIKNTGDKLLVIEGVSTSCGCTTVTYSKEPVQPGKEIVLEVRYKAEHPEHFNKTITVYCNAETSPLVLQINGDAK